MSGFWWQQRVASCASSRRSQFGGRRRKSSSRDRVGAAKRHLDDVAIFRDRWVRRYLPVVRFVAIQARDVADPRVSAVAQRDPTDGAFAALVSLLARSLASCGSYLFG